MISKDFKQLIPRIQEYLKGQPVKKAWLFGSCSRGEERPDSDVDLLVEYDRTSRVTLFTVSGIRVGLRDLLNREIDLVEDGYLMPYAAQTAQQDKILIYERDCQG